MECRKNSCINDGMQKEDELSTSFSNAMIFKYKTDWTKKLVKDLFHEFNIVQNGLLNIPTYTVIM